MNINEIGKNNLLKFLTEYTYKNKKYLSHIFATSEEEAEKKLKAKKETESIRGWNPNTLYLNIEEYI